MMTPDLIEGLKVIATVSGSMTVLGPTFFWLLVQPPLRLPFTLKLNQKVNQKRTLAVDA